jgi:predicted PhzF superfamily epimerase YddE/YHI9
MALDLMVVDAFTEEPFKGNPAAVAILEAFPDNALMQAVAREMNLSETAFVVPRADGDYDLRWFTPTTEVDLCGHATLAATHVLGGSNVGIPEDPVTGAAHCALAVYWAERLGREALVGEQASPRGGKVGMRFRGDRVTLSGQAVTVARTQILAWE